jgi:Zn-dependent protease with chaperone function
LAITVPNNISGTKIKGSLIILNDTASTVIDQKSRDELVAIMAHEIGHAIGLGHSPVVDSLMYYSVIPKRRSLGVDDIDGITYLYPKQQPVSCGQIIDSKNNLNGFIVPMLLGLVIALLSYLAFLKLRPRFSHSLS